MPTLQYLADNFYEDNDIEYVYNESQKIASIKKEKIDVTGEYIYTKLAEYPYEFKIDGKLRLAAVDGISLEEDTETVTIPKEEYEQLKRDTVSSKIKIGQLTMKGSNNNFFSVVFDEPFEDNNYSICLQIMYAPYFNNIQYGYSDKTEKGFTIWVTTNSSDSWAYDVNFDWSAVHQ